MKRLHFSSCQAACADEFCQRVTDYVLDKLSLPGAYEQLSSWQARHAMLLQGEIQVCWLCGLTYVQLFSGDSSSVELLAAPIMSSARYGGLPIYFSDVVVRHEEPLYLFSDLRGKRWAFNEYGSHSGYNITRYQLARLGEDGTFFGEIIMAGSHQDALRLLLQGEIDGAAIDSTVLETELALNPQMASAIRVVDRWGPSPIPPWIIRTSLDRSLRDALRGAFLTMHQDDEGQAILAAGGVSRFAQVSDADYDLIREMMIVAQQVNLRPTR